KIGVAQFPPIFFTALRFGALALFLLPVLRLHRGEMKPLLAAAMLTGPAAFGLLFVGLYIAEDASPVAIATQRSVRFSPRRSVRLLGEVIRWRRALGIVLACMGMAVLSFDPRVWTDWEGVAVVVASCFGAPLGLIYVKRVRGVQRLELQAWIAVA